MNPSPDPYISTVDGPGMRPAVMVEFDSPTWCATPDQADALAAALTLHARLAREQDN